MAYSDEQKAEALAILAACDGNAHQAARFLAEKCNLPISHDQLTAWSQGKYVHESVTELSVIKKLDLADLIELEVRGALEAAPEKRYKAEYHQLWTGIGIGVDKMRLLREQATTISQTNLSDDERAARVRELYQKAMQRKAEAIEAKFEEETDVAKMETGTIISE